MMLTKKLVETVVMEVAGDDVVPLVRELKDKKNVSEFKLAESIDQEINATRNMLYRLYDNNLVSFTRKKDKKKGWYIYYWTFNKNMIRHLVVQIKRNRANKLQDRLDRESSGQFFLCPQNCIRLDFEKAMNFEFRCPECGSLIEQQDNSEIKTKIVEEIEEIKKWLKENDPNEKSVKKIIKKRVESKAKKVEKKKEKKITAIKKEAKIKKKVVKAKKKVTKKTTKKVK